MDLYEVLSTASRRLTRQILKQVVLAWPYWDDDELDHIWRTHPSLLRERQLT